MDVCHAFHSLFQSELIHLHNKNAPKSRNRSLCGLHFKVLVLFRDRMVLMNCLIFLERIKIYIHCQVFSYFSNSDMQSQDLNILQMSPKPSRDITNTMLFCWSPETPKSYSQWKARAGSARKMPQNTISD